MANSIKNPWRHFSLGECEHMPKCTIKLLGSQIVKKKKLIEIICLMNLK